MLHKRLQIQVKQRLRENKKLERESSEGGAQPDEAVEPPKDSDASKSDVEEEQELVAELTWTSGAPVERSDENGPFLEVLGLEDGQVRLDYFNSGNAPVLDSHNNESVSNILGVVTKAWLDGEGERVGRATVRFSNREEVKSVYNDIQDGIIRNCSVGYRVYAYEEQEAVEGTLRTLVATDWEPVELSLCPVGADSRAGFRSMEKEVMEVKGAETQVSPKDIILQERSRIAEIRKATLAANLGEDVAGDLIERGVSLDESRKVILDQLAERSKAQTQHSVVSGAQDDREVMKRGMLDALLSRHDSKRYPVTDQAKRFMHLRLVEMAKKTLREPTEGLQDSDIITRSMMGTSDFPALLSLFSNRLLRDSFELAPQSWRQWTRQSVAKDFRPQFKIMLSDVAQMEPLGEQGEYKATALTEGLESVQPSTYGQVLHVSRQALINDDLNAFSRIPELMARSANELIATKVYGLLKANPVMNTDKTRCFDPKHNNDLPQDTINLESLTIARKQMRLQTTMKGNPLGLIPKYLLTTANNEIPATQLISQNFLAGAIEGVIQQKINPFVNAFDLIIEPRLDTLIGPNCWFTIADGIETVEVCFLNGQDTVYIEQQLGFSTDGISLKGRLDFGAAVIEWRGMSRNVGGKK